MKKTHIAALLAALLSGCGDPADRVEGTYVGVKQPWFGPTITMFLVFKDDTAEMMSDKSRAKVQYHLDREENRLILNDGPGQLGLVFMIRDNGKTLTCNTCGEVGIPETWEYSRSDPETLTGRTWRKISSWPPPGQWRQIPQPKTAGKKRPEIKPKPKPKPSLLTRSVEGAFVGLGYDPKRKLPVRLSITVPPYKEGVDGESVSLIIEDPYDNRLEQSWRLERGTRNTIRLRPNREAYGRFYEVVPGQDGTAGYLVATGGILSSEILLPSSARHAARDEYPVKTKLGLIDWPGLTPTAQVAGTFRKGSRLIRIDGDTMTFEHMRGERYRFKLERGKYWIVARPLDKALAGTEFSIAPKEQGRWLFIRKLKGPNSSPANALVETWKKEGA